MQLSQMWREHLQAGCPLEVRGLNIAGTQIGELDAEIGDWWRHFQQAAPAEREGMLTQSREPGRRRSRSRRRRSTARNASPASSESVA